MAYKPAHEEDEGIIEAKPPNKQAISTSFCQWSVLPNDAYSPSGPRKMTLDPGVYTVTVLPDIGLVFVKAKLITDSLIELDDSASEQVLTSMRKFWQSKKEYDKRKIVYKRGILLEGPAGSGKTSTVNLLTRELIDKHNGIVLICGHPGHMAVGLENLRRIEPDRNIIVIFEDIDEMIDHFGEHVLLAMLDGEFQIDNVCNIATTNFPDKLGARICNRPSRFDERILVGMPNARSREIYLSHILKDEPIDKKEIKKWVTDTDSFSIAHLKELAIAIFCLGQTYDTVLRRLKDMMIKPNSIPEFRRGSGGFQVLKEALDEVIEDMGGSAKSAQVGFGK